MRTPHRALPTKTSEPTTGAAALVAFIAKSILPRKSPCFTNTIDFVSIGTNYPPRRRFFAANSHF